MVTKHSLMLRMFSCKSFSVKAFQHFLLFVWLEMIFHHKIFYITREKEVFYWGKCLTVSNSVRHFLKFFLFTSQHLETLSPSPSPSPSPSLHCVPDPEFISVSKTISSSFIEKKKKALSIYNLHCRLLL
ncbi:hypothetical protein V6Z12_A05G324100 [Gossypium hirsutum]